MPLPVNRPIRLLVADDDPLIRMVLAAVAGREPTLELIAEAEDAGQAIELVARHRPDVVLLDVEMPDGGGLRAATEIRERHPDVRVVALSADESPRARRRMAEAGAAGYVVKGAAPDEIVRALRGALDG
jgi:DNA-binding NarL/FixJ family response regulator